MLVKAKACPRSWALPSVMHLLLWLDFICLALGGLNRTEHYEWLPNMGVYTVGNLSDIEPRHSFDVALLLVWDFNLYKSRSIFKQLTKEYPACRMCWWGLGYSYQQYLNKPFNSDIEQHEARSAADRALALLSAHPLPTRKERALIEALPLRYPASQPSKDSVAAQKRGLREYAEQLEQFLDAQFDVDVAVACVEAWMTYQVMSSDDEHAFFINTRSSAIQPNPIGRKSLSLLEKALANAQRHPAAMHLYIHLLDPGRPGRRGPFSAGRAEAAADELRAYARGTEASHFNHMPSHTYMRVGRYMDVAGCGLAAMRIDSIYVDGHGMDTIGAENVDHDIGFFVRGAEMAGMKATAVRAAERQQQLYRQFPDWGSMAQPSPGVAWNWLLTVYARFGDWEGLLSAANATVEAPRVWPFGNSVLRSYSVGLALAHIGQLQQARAQLETLKAIQVPDELDGMRTSTLHKICIITLEALLLVLSPTGSPSSAVAPLREAVTLYENLKFIGLPLWHVPLQQCLGQVLLDAGRAKEAKEAFLMDLEGEGYNSFPHNGWSLMGLAAAQGALGDTIEANRTEIAVVAAFAKAEPSRPICACPMFCTLARKTILHTSLI